MRPDETSEERTDRNLIELLNELRIVLPGVQVLFAFLLIAPFSAGFGETTSFERLVYLITLLLAALAAALLMAPTAHHRLRFHKGDRLFIVNAGSHLATAGLICVALAMCGVILLVTSFVFGDLAAVVATGSTALVFVILWFVVPLVHGWLRSRSEG